MTDTQDPVEALMLAAGYEKHGDPVVYTLECDGYRMRVPPNRRPVTTRRAWKQWRRKMKAVLRMRRAEVMEDDQ